MKGIEGFIPNLDGRQHSQVAYFEVDLSGFVDNDNVIELELPANSEVTRVFANVTEAFDGGTTDTVAIGDSVSATRYLAATTIKTTGLKAGAATGYIHGVDGTPQKLTITRATTGTAATAGVLRIYVETVSLGKGYYTQG